MHAEKKKVYVVTSSLKSKELIVVNKQNKKDIKVIPCELMKLRRTTEGGSVLFHSLENLKETLNSQPSLIDVPKKRALRKTK